jgi:hypothetical protein
MELDREDAGLATEYHLLWLGVIFDLLGFGIGFGSLNAIWIVVAVPTRSGVIKLATLAGLVMPALTGIVDLVLRAQIP